MTSRLAVILAVLLGATGCARLKPYERGRLAHPTMLLGDMARPGAAHVYAIREGAVGGGAGAEGGCGCN
ncbi:MAG: DUF4266 domain-containing protein [Myxococcota bacterium]|nr:DUF4266 domain-containing protein [Myxococcota bacterium]